MLVFINEVDIFVPFFSVCSSISFPSSDKVSVDSVGFSENVRSGEKKSCRVGDSSKDCRRSFKIPLREYASVRGEVGGGGLE